MDESHVSKEEKIIDILTEIESRIYDKKITVYNNAIVIGKYKYATNAVLAEFADRCYEDCIHIIRTYFEEKIGKIVNQEGNVMQTKLEIMDVNIIVPNKVVEVTFADGTKEKSVCREPDTFSLESAISICISKKIMGGSSAYNNAVKRAMKVYEDKQKREVAEKAEQERIEKKRAKRLAYKERRAVKRAEEEKQRKAKEREEQIAIQTEAYLRAMDIMKSENKSA